MFSLKTKVLSNSFSRIILDRRFFQNGQFKIISDFFDQHPINQQTIDDLERLSDERKKSHGDIDRVKKLYKNIQDETNTEKRATLETLIREEFKKFPNNTHPQVLSCGFESGNVEVDSYGEEVHKDGKDYVTLANLLNMIRVGQLGNFTGSRSYYLYHQLAELVRAQR